MQPSLKDQYDLAVIGAGPAGTSAALRAVELGASVVVIEAERTGGTCVNSGCVPTRVLAKTARLMRETRTAAAYGISPGTSPIDWAATVARVHEIVDRVRAVKMEPERFAARGVDLVTGEGRARFGDDSTLELEGSGRRIRASSIIVAVGGHSRRLPIPGAELATVPEHVLDLPSLPRRVAIIGAGNTGAQLATVFDSFGAEVDLLDLAPRILVASDPEISDAVAAAFADQGIRVRTGIAGVDRLVPAAGGAVTLEWRDGDLARSQEFDAVIMATGWPAHLEPLQLERAGIRADRRSIPVDRALRSEVPHIFAVGDANGQDMLVQAAQFEGETAAENAVLGTNRRGAHQLLPAGGFTDPDYAGVGLTEAEARARDPRCVVARVAYSELDRAVIDDREIGFLKLIADRRRTTILGAHAVGEQAVEVVQAVTTAMAAGIDVTALAEVRFAYPTYSAIVGMAARRLLGTDADDGELR